MSLICGIIYYIMFTLPFDITAAKKRVITNVVDNLNMVELCELLEVGVLAAN